MTHLQFSFPYGSLMSNRQIGFIIVFLAALHCAPTCCAQSIWAKRNPRFSHFFFDTGARRAGDLLTVLVRENTDVTNRDQRSLGKTTSAGFDFDFAGASTGAASSANATIAKNSNREFDGDSQYQIARQFTDRITVQVIEVRPNGDLVIAGSRTQVVGEEQRQLMISGVVRPQDVSANNTVTSQYVADFRVEYQGCGPETHFTNQGWVGRITNRIWPF